MSGSTSSPKVQSIFPLKRVELHLPRRMSDVSVLEHPAASAISGSFTVASFGWSVAISGTTMVVGAPAADTSMGSAGAGRAYVFEA